MVSPDNNIKFANSTRFIILAISLLALSVVTSNTVILNFTIICMTLTDNDNDNVNHTAQYSLANPKYKYTSLEKSLLISATNIGNLFGTYPVMFLQTTFGVRVFFTTFGFISAFATFLLPYFASISVWLLIVGRFVEGFAAAPTYPVVGTIVTKWAPLKETGLFMALLLCYFQFAPLFTMPVSGALCTSRYGWPAAYYVHGAVTVIIFGLFFLLYRDSPRRHRNVSQKELLRIEIDKEVSAKKKMPPVPLGAILRDTAVWGIWIGFTGACLGFQIFFQYGPIYLNKVRNFGIESTGFAAALPSVLSVVVKIFAGPLSDHATGCSNTARVKIFAFISQSIMITSIILLALLPASWAAIGQIAYTAAIASSGLNSMGVTKAGQLIGAQHGHFMLSVFSFISCILSIAIPFFVSFLAPSNQPQNWAVIFYIIAGIMIVTNGIFFLVGSGEPAKWTKSNWGQVYVCPDEKKSSPDKLKISA